MINVNIICALKSGNQLGSCCMTLMQNLGLFIWVFNNQTLSRSQTMILGY